VTIPLWIKAAVKLLILPPAGPILVVLVGVAMLPRYPQRGRRLATFGVVTLLLLSLPIVAALLIRALDRAPVFDLSQAANAQAIVILGGGTRDYAPEFGGVTLNTLTLERVRYGARLARNTGLPVLVSGGSVAGRPPEALLMRSALTQEYGVPVRWVETSSRNTHENAVESSRILKASGIARVILVVHSFDVARVRAEFAAAGVTGIPAATYMPSPHASRFSDFLPSPAGLQSSYYALYEMMAMALFYVTHSTAATAI
jgi:uncharacterized SAM-binding protein YcdF (DUF218 family)